MTNTDTQKPVVNTVISRSNHNKLSIRKMKTGKPIKVLIDEIIEDYFKGTEEEKIIIQ